MAKHHIYQTDDFDELRIWWDKVEPTYAHIGRPSSKYVNEFERCLLNASLTDIETIVDYGCGGGNLGHYLFEKKEIAYYIGMDLSKRSIDAAKRRFDNFKSDFILIGTEDFQFPDADAFMCFHVIQHFMNLDYTDRFFDSLNETKYKFLFLQFRKAEIPEHHAENTDISVMLPIDYVISKLNTYHLKEHSYYKRDNYIYSKWSKK